MHPEAKVRTSSTKSLYLRFTWDCKTDSTVLAYVMKTLNERYQYGLELFLLSIDEGITGYRDDSLEVSQSCLGVLHISLTCRFTDSQTESTAV